MADILTQLQTCLDQLATQFYATLGYLTTYHDNAPTTPPPNVPDAVPALAKIAKNSSAPPVPAAIANKVGGAATVAGNASPPHAPPQQPGAAPGTAREGDDPNLPPAPDSPRTFASRQRELARDLIIKEQQIEYLISVLPGIGASEAEQETRIRELETELREVEKERAAKVRELKKLRTRLEDVLGAVAVGIHGDGCPQR
ncbi:Mediator complex subunit Med21 [Penicillium cf. griseofulvum]|uniref:Mediator of RNA polymerase II transcription subunit 21 n=1 Tax=Penicillium cf. griseofulvum TaxID=2972120 RepID=A0A9W9M572_9EURO|nr:Mediator complex subunit Med21 [Penicillium cf. griseofulvum]KAJ5434920.1 Mediator complex subunit Med21 [Penicillium cf. griseofulvum]KAJ5452753.1 Mediator complex subunit Med21 [Penicillium cf. griseofulvum]